VVFVLLRVAPGDPVAMMIAPGSTAADIAALRARHGLDLPIPQQFAIWLGQLAGGDLGTSISMKQGVAGLIAGRLPATLELALVALAIAFLAAGLLAVTAQWAESPILRGAIDNANGLFLAVPDFIWALALVLLLGVLWPVLPTSGRIDPRLDAAFLTRFYLIESLLTFRWGLAASLLGHLLMPALALGLPLAAVLVRLLRNALATEAVQDYALLARLRGRSRLGVILRETLRNAAVPTLALAGVQVTFLIGGTVIVERIFAFPGIGNLAIDAVINRDLPLIQGLVLTFAILFIAINLGIEALYRLLNPRLRHG
jgi:peptide/nickel transport system permease protein